MLAYFEAARIAPSRELAAVTTVTEGEKVSSAKTEVRRICAELPTFEGFAVSIKVPSRTFNDWLLRHQEFSQAHARAKDIQYQILVDRGLTRQYDPAAFAFVAKNITWMKDRIAQEISGPDGAPVALSNTITIELVRAKDGRPALSSGSEESLATIETEKHG